MADTLLRAAYVTVIGEKGTTMPASVLLVHDEQDTRDLAVIALRAAFLEVVGFEDPMAALNAIETDSRVRVLVTPMKKRPVRPAVRSVP